MENVFNGLCALLGEPTGAGKAAFVDAEGVELMIIMMKWVFSDAPQSFLSSHW